MQSAATKAALIAAAAGLLLTALPADAGPSRAELLAGRDAGVGHHAAGVRDGRHDGRYGRDEHRRHENRGTRGHQRSRHSGTYDRQHHYASARRYAANAVRQARQAHQLGYYPNHPRWSLNFQRHFKWALGADSYKLEREARRRARKLRELRRHARHPHGYAGY